MQNVPRVVKRPWGLSMPISDPSEYLPIEPPPEDPKAAKGMHSKKHFGRILRRCYYWITMPAAIIAAAVVVAVAPLALTPVGGRMQLVPLASGASHSASGALPRRR